MLVRCTRPECLQGNGCTRATKRLQADIKRSIADIQAGNGNPHWPLVCPPAVSLLSRAQAVPVVTTTSMPALPAAVLGHILCYLPPREMHSTAFLNKDMMASATVDIVQHSAMMSGGRPRQTIDVLLKLMDAKSIHPPSALRLLCLVNGIRCELCTVSLVNHVRKGFGIFVCWHCLTKQETTQRVVKSSFRGEGHWDVAAGLISHNRLAVHPFDFHPVRGNGDVVRAELLYARHNHVPYKFRYEVTPNGGNSRVLQVWGGRLFMWRSPFVDRRGEKAGPVFTFLDFQIIMQDILQHSLTEQAPAHNFAKSIADQYIEDAVGATNADEEQYKGFVRMYKNTLWPAERRSSYRQWKRMNGSAKWRINKLNSTVKVLERLSDLADLPRVREGLLFDINPLYLSGPFAVSRGRLPAVILKSKKQTGFWQVIYLVRSR